MRILGRHVVFEQVKTERRAAYAGLFWTPSLYGPGHVVFVCPVPFIVFRFRVTRSEARRDWP